MKIAVNTRLLITDKLDGIGWFTYETMRYLTTKYSRHEFIFFFDRPYSETFLFSDNITPVVKPPPARHPLLWYWWFEHSVPVMLKKYKPDVFLSPDGYLSLRTNVPSVAVIHDINFEHYPEQLPFLTRKYYQHYFPKFARKSDRIATVSEFSKNDIVDKYGIDAGKIDVVYNGVNEAYRDTARVDKKSVMNEYTSGEEYLLFVGTIHQRKNIERLMLAYDEFKKETGSPLKLLVVGRKMWWTADMEETYRSMVHKNDVVFAGRVDPIEKLRDVVASAKALVYVPVFEGFGIPVIEAQAAGVPVVTSDCSSLPEITNGSALLCDPFSVESIKGAMKRIVNDNSLRASLLRSGNRNANKYSWEATAEELWKTILTVAGHG